MKVILYFGDVKAGGQAKFSGHINDKLIERPEYHLKIGMSKLDSNIVQCTRQGTYILLFSVTTALSFCVEVCPCQIIREAANSGRKYHNRIFIEMLENEVCTA